MKDYSAVALKEWAVVVRALREGRQVLLLRKGGIEDDGGEFKVEQREFFLYPTYAHQNEVYVKPPYQQYFREALAAQPGPGKVLIDTYAVVEGVLGTGDAAALGRLDREHIWTAEHLGNRLNYRPKDPLRVLILRAYRLQEPVVMEDLPQYAGCRSWVPLVEEMKTWPSEPVLPDSAFLARVEAARRVLMGDVGVR